MRAPRDGRVRARRLVEVRLGRLVDVGAKEALAREVLALLYSVGPGVIGPADPFGASASETRRASSGPMRFGQLGTCYRHST